MALKRTAKSCGPDAPTLVSSWRATADDGGKQARSPGRARRKPLKPLRGECRVISGVTVVTMLVCFVLFRTRGCGCSGHPAFPAPSEFQGQRFHSKLARYTWRDREAVFAVIARSEATKQSSFLLGVAMDCFASLAMTAGIEGNAPHFQSSSPAKAGDPVFR